MIRSSCLPSLALVLVVLSIFMTQPSAHSQVVVNNPVVPGGYEEVDGNSILAEPFSLSGQGIAAVRMQQVYSASEFLESTGSDGGWIYEIGFRADHDIVEHGYTASSPNLEIRLSVTGRGPDELSPIFAENLGSSVSLVVSGSRIFGVSAYGDVDPNPFTLFFTFAQPYYYDPSKGNLLLDVINIGGQPLAGLDAVDISGDGVSRVCYRDFGTQIPPSGTVDTKGLVTIFSIVPVPEPSTWVLMGMGAVVLVWRYRHSIQKRKVHHVTH